MYNSTHITVKRAKQLVQAGALLLDVRTPVHFRDGSIPGAINVSTRSISSLLKLPKSTKLVFFGVDDNDTTIETMINYAIQMGFLDVFTFGGIDNWDK